MGWPRGRDLLSILNSGLAYANVADLVFSSGKYPFFIHIAAYARFFLDMSVFRKASQFSFRSSDLPMERESSYRIEISFTISFGSLLLFIEGSNDNAFVEKFRDP